MFRARERGMSFWPFAICLLGLLIFVFLWFGATSERDNALAQASRAESARKTAEDERAKTLDKFQKVSNATGFLAGGNFTDVAELDRVVKEYAAKIKDAATVTYPVSRYQADPSGGGTVEKADAGTVTVAYMTEQESAEAKALQSWFPKIETALGRYKHDTARAFEHAETLGTEKAAITKTGEDTVKDKDKRIGELQNEKAALENQARE